MEKLGMEEMKIGVFLLNKKEDEHEIDEVEHKKKSVHIDNMAHMLIGRVASELSWNIKTCWN